MGPRLQWEGNQVLLEAEQRLGSCRSWHREMALLLASAQLQYSVLLSLIFVELPFSMATLLLHQKIKGLREMELLLSALWCLYLEQDTCPPSL